MDDLIIYIGLNIGITPMMDDEDKKKVKYIFMEYLSMLRTVIYIHILKN